MNRFLFSQKAKYRFLRHLLFFCLVTLLFSLIVFKQGDDKNFFRVLYIVFLNALVFFSYAYITIFLIIPEFILKNRLLSGMLIFGLVGIGLSAIKLLGSGEIFYSTLAPENIEKTGFFNLRYIIVNTKDMTYIVAVFCVAKYAKDYLYAEKIRRDLEERNKEAQNKLLQSQFNPHFLFNTINNLYALSLLDPGKTKEVIARFKKVLEYVTEKSQKRFVEVEDELILLENYIQLEKMRYGDRLNVHLSASGKFKGELVPPLVFFVLVENCFEHGSSLDAGNPWIRIKLGIDNEKLEFITENSKPHNGNSSASSRDGVSLSNLQKRLKLLYEGHFSLQIENKEDTFKTHLSLTRSVYESSR